MLHIHHVPGIPLAIQKAGAVYLYTLPITVTRTSRSMWIMESMCRYPKGTAQVPPPRTLDPSSFLSFVSQVKEQRMDGWVDRLNNILHPNWMDVFFIIRSVISTTHSRKEISSSSGAWLAPRLALCDLSSDGDWTGVLLPAGAVVLLSATWRKPEKNIRGSKQKNKGFFIFS